MSRSHASTPNPAPERRRLPSRFFVALWKEIARMTRFLDVTASIAIVFLALLTGFATAGLGV